MAENEDREWRRQAKVGAEILDVWKETYDKVMEGERLEASTLHETILDNSDIRSFCFEVCEQVILKALPKLKEIE